MDIVEVCLFWSISAPQLLVRWKFSSSQSVLSLNCDWWESQAENLVIIFYSEHDYANLEQWMVWIETMKKHSPSPPSPTNNSERLSHPLSPFWIMKEWCECRKQTAAERMCLLGWPRTWIKMNLFTFVSSSLFSLFIFHDPPCMPGMLNLGTHYKVGACYCYQCYACFSVCHLSSMCFSVLCDLWNEREREQLEIPNKIWKIWGGWVEIMMSNRQLELVHSKFGDLDRATPNEFPFLIESLIFLHVVCGIC